MLKKPKAIPQRLPPGPETKMEPSPTSAGACVSRGLSLANPPSNPTRVVSKLRTGPGAVITSMVQVPPPAQSALVWHGPPGLVPPVQTPGTGEAGCGNFWKSGTAGGIGEVRPKFVGMYAVKPL